jgi:hypothetical protein
MNSPKKTAMTKEELIHKLRQLPPSVRIQLLNQSLKNRKAKQDISEMHEGSPKADGLGDQAEPKDGLEPLPE